MRLPRKPKRKARIEIIPMIDTMFFLLVFFMVATLSMTIQRGLQVNLPQAATGLDEIRQITSLTLTKDGKIYVDKEEVDSVSDAVARLRRSEEKGKEAAVVINADRAVEHGRVVDLMDAVKQAGITRIAVAVRPRK